MLLYLSVIGCIRSFKSNVIYFSCNLLDQISPLLNLIERPIEDTLNLDLSLTPDTSGMLFVDLNKIFSRRLRLYARTPIGDDQKSNPQIFSLEYRFNNLIYGEISNERINQISSTSGRFRLRLSWDSF